MQMRGKVARYESALSTLPSELHFEGGDLPVTLIYEDEPQAFARGGLVRTADRIKKAGRYGDTEIIHVNKDELEELKQLWGEPTINPQTGCPEYFLKKLWKGVKKIAKPLAQIAPLAAMFIPGVGPLAAAAIGAASGGITGGLKGAVVGGALGGLGASGAVGKTIGSIAPGLSPVAARAAQGAVLGGLGSAARDGNLLGGAITGGALGAAIGPGGVIRNSAPGTLGSGPNPDGSMSLANDIAVNRNYIPSPSASPGAIGAPPIDVSQLRVDLPPLQQPWLQRPFLGISSKVPNMIGAPVAGALALSALSAKKTPASAVNASMPVQDIVDKRFQPTFGAKLPDATGMYADLAARPQAQRALAEQYRYGLGPERSYFDYVPQGYAKGGKIKSDHDGDEPSPFAVRGKGTGRSDEIDAKLSDGEYVMDAETVALLGDGSNEAGAKRLDQMRVNLRKHKGKNLAKGKFSVNAKRPEAYMAGGSV